MRIRLAIVLCFTVLCLAWVVWGLDVVSGLESLGRFRWGFLVPIWGQYLCAHVLRAQRFRILLPMKLDYRASFSALSIGYLALHVFPFRLGELVRPYLVSEQRQVPFGDSLAVVVIERILDVMCLLAMVLATSWFVDLPTQIEVHGYDLLGIAQRAAGGLALAGAVGVGGVVALGPRALTFTDRLPAGALFRRFRASLVARTRRPAVAAQAVALSAMIWLLTLAAVQVQLNASPGLPRGFLDALTAWTATLSGMAVLPTPGFFGGFEAACTAALLLLGAPQDLAAPFAIVLHLTQFVFTVALGGCFLIVEGLSLKDIVTRSRAP